MQEQGAPAATARVARRLPVDRWFYIGMAICTIITVVLGFAPSIVNGRAESSEMLDQNACPHRHNYSCVGREIQ
jgi:hypothetical protein